MSVRPVRARSSALRGAAPVRGGARLRGVIAAAGRRAHRGRALPPGARGLHIPSLEPWTTAPRSRLDALAAPCNWNEAERAHLIDLVRAAGPTARARRKSPAQQVRPSVARVLSGMIAVPAFVHNGRLDVLAANPLTEALFAPVHADPTRPVNHAWFTFLDPHARDFWIDWERAADDAVAMLRTEAGRDPHDRALTNLVGELSTRSDAFRIRWAAHNVRLHRTGLKHVRHPVVGELHLSYDVMELPADPGLSLIAFSTEAGSHDDDALRLLAGWAATHNPADALATPNRA